MEWLYEGWIEKHAEASVSSWDVISWHFPGASWIQFKLFIPFLSDPFCKLSSRLCLHPTSCICSLNIYNQNVEYISLHSCQTPSSSHAPWLDHHNNIWQNKLLSSSLCSFLWSPVNLLSPGSECFDFSSLFAFTVNFLYSERPRVTTNTVQEPTLHLYLLMFTSVDGRLKSRRFRTEWHKHSPNFISS